MKRVAKHAFAAVMLVLSMAAPSTAEPYDVPAVYAVGEAVVNGDYATALGLARPLADQGNADAQYWLGNIYYDGLGVPQDHETTAKWYRKAADQGHGSAQHNLAYTYKDGRGVPQNYVMAHMWLNLSITRETNRVARNVAAQERDFLAKNMTLAQIAEAQKLAREWKPK